LKVVADSSYITAALLEDALLLEKDELLLSPDIAFYEVIHAIWKHQVVLRKVVDTRRHVDSFLRLIDSGKIQLLKPDMKIVHQAYDLAVEKKTGFYDAVFVAIAKELAVELRTFDKKQAAIFKA
jgi:predicted nucleic acid-binding protein